MILQNIDTNLLVHAERPPKHVQRRENLEYPREINVLSFQVDAILCDREQLGSSISEHSVHHGCRMA